MTVKSTGPVIGRILVGVYGSTGPAPGDPLDINDPTFVLMDAGVPMTPIYAIGSDGTPPYTYSVIAGALPVGVTLNASTGEISGTPTIIGSGNVTFRVTDDVADTADSLSRPWVVQILIG